MRDGWRYVALGEACHLYQPEALAVRKLSGDGAYDVFGAGGRIGRHASYNHEKPQLVIGCRGSCGVINITPPRTWITSNAMVIAPRGAGLGLRFLRYALEQADIRAAISGVAQPQITRQSLSPTIIPVPPLAEQERIVAVLDEAFESIATAAANTASISEAVPEIIAEEIDSILASGRAGWSSAMLGDVCEVLDARRRPVTKKDRAAGPYPYYGATGVQDHVAEYLFDEPLVLLGEDGAKWSARERSAFTISGRTWVNNHAHVLRPNRNRLLDEWLILTLNAADLSDHITGVTVPKLNQARMREIPLSIPSLDVQRTLLQRIEGIRAETDRAAEACTRKLVLLAELKQSLLARAFSGELTARDRVKSATPAANDNTSATLEQVANVLAFGYRRHEQRGRGETFKHTKAQKLLHFVESVGGVELGRRPYKDAAGPNDSPHMRSAEDWARAHGFFDFERQSSGDYLFKKLPNYRKMIEKAEAALAPVQDRIERATDLIVDLDWRGAEVLATVHAAWNNLILDGAEPTEDAIVREARDEWHVRKMEIPERAFRDAIKSIRRRGIVPDGSAKRVGEPKLL